MSVGQIIIDVLLMALATLAAIVLIGTFARRILGVRISVVRILIAGVLGLGAEIGFESRFVWHTTYNAAFIPMQLGIILFVAIAFLVVAELLVPQGSIPRPDQWMTAMRRGADRSTRYTELVRIAFRHKLIPFRLSTGTTSIAIEERTKQAQALKAALEDAGGAFIKLGQILSTRTDVLPVEFTTELSTLQQRVPPEPWERVLHVLNAELDQPLDAVFAQIDHEPLAAASIGQVHLATLATGEQVAVKVQREGIIPLVERDVDITRRIARRLMESSAWAQEIGVSDLAESLASSLLDEIDYRVETANMVAMSATQQLHPATQRIGIPKAYERLCTKRVLVMDYVQGSTLSDPDATADLDTDRRHELAKKLLRSILSQIMDDGTFHADLHPGNIMITTSGDLALLDFGSIGRLDSETRRQITDLLLAFSRGDARQFSDALIAFIELPDDLDEFALRRQIGDFVARYLGPGSTLDMAAFAQVIAVLTANRLTAPAALTIAVRAVATVEGTLRALSPGFDFLTAASNYAQERLDQAKQPAAIARTIIDELGAAIPLARRLPRRIDTITGSLAEGRLSVNVRLLADHRDRKLLREFINLAALTFLAGVSGIMAAMLITSTSGPAITNTITLHQLFGYLLVIVSGVLTLRVLFDILRRRRQN